MKQFFLIFSFLMGYVLAAPAEEIRLVPSADDSTRMDTVVISELSDADDPPAYRYTGGSPFFDENHMAGSAATFALITIIIVCGLPLFIVSATLWFRYKNKQAKYRLAAEALAAGQSIPKELFKETDRHHEILSKGIRNIFLGIGLGVFFWVISEEAGLAAIGFLVFCMGAGQVLIAYTTRPKKEDNG